MNITFFGKFYIGFKILFAMKDKELKENIDTILEEIRDFRKRLPEYSLNTLSIQEKIKKIDLQIKKLILKNELFYRLQKLQSFYFFFIGVIFTISISFLLISWIISILSFGIAILIFIIKKVIDGGREKKAKLNTTKKLKEKGYNEEEIKNIIQRNIF